ncbi:MAG: carboxypeptidase regulatory-like domain-containing protein [Candidatus Tenebribacter burtonii]|nr:carboxypeptidase regulatory-like domain-containing protein [Candidatus Tenebribacter burtonii]
MAYYEFPGSLPATVLNGESPFTGWGPDYYTWVYNDYQNAVNVPSPAALSIISVEPNPESGIEVTIQVDITENIIINENVLFAIPTINNGGNYTNMALALGYTDMPLTAIGESQQFIINIPIDPVWDYSELNFVAVLQSGVFGREIDRPILQAAQSESAFPFINAEVIGNIIDQYSSEPVANANIRLGGFETVTDENGDYALPLMIGSYNVYVEDEDYNDFVGQFTIAGNTEVLDITLVRAQLAPNDLAGFPLGNDELELEWVMPGKIKGVREDFDDGVLPEGWSNDSGNWLITDNGSSSTYTIPDFDGYYACITGNNGGMLNLPVFDLSRINELDLTFNVYYRLQNGNSYDLSIMISIDGGNNWNNIYTVPSSSSWNNVNIDLSMYCGEGFDNVQLAFNGDSIGGSDSGCAIDDVICGRGFRNWDILGYNLYEEGNSVPINGNVLIDNRNYSIPLPTVVSSFYVTAMYDTGESQSSNIYVFNSLSGDDHQIETQELQLNAYPNPFNPSTNINYNLSSKLKVVLQVFNVKGQKVRTLVNETQNAGYHNIVWNGKDDNSRNVTSGIYFYKFKINEIDYTNVKKVILLK